MNIVLLIVSVLVSVTIAEDVEYHDVHDRNGKFFSLFTVVKFENGPCNTTDNRVGVCYTKSECLRAEGTPTGTCAAGFGVCCLISRTCQTSTKHNNTYFENPNENVFGTCEMVVNKVQDDICQLRLDFDSMDIGDPSEPDQLCLNDVFRADCGRGSVLDLCGSNTGQHLYVNAGAVGGQCRLSVSTIGTTLNVGTQKAWRVLVAQIECNHVNRAPDSCLQFHTGMGGTLMSFNFNSGIGRQLADQDYTICVRMEEGMCGIVYTPCDPTAQNEDGSLTSFSISPPATSAGVGDQFCTADYLTIPCATNNRTPVPSETCVDRLCGGRFSASSEVVDPTLLIDTQVYSYSKPFEIRVKFDAVEPTDEMSSGFCLNYLQLSC